VQKGVQEETKGGQAAMGARSAGVDGAKKREKKAYGQKKGGQKLCLMVGVKARVNQVE